MELGASTTLLQGETIDKGVFVILLKVLALGNKETVKLGYRRGKDEHETHDREGEEMLKDDEQSQFKKLDMNIWNELCLDDMESPWDFEKARFESIKKAGRTLRKAKTSKPGDHNEAITMIYEGSNYDKMTQARSFDTNIHSQETSRCEHPQLWMEVSKIPGDQPFNDARSLPKQVKTGLNASDRRPFYEARNLSKQVETSLTERTGLQEVPDSARQ